MLMFTVATTRKGSGVLLYDTYLGLLYPTEDYKVYVLPNACRFDLESDAGEPCSYGYVTNTRLKIIIVIDDEEVKEALDLKPVSIVTRTSWWD